LISTTNYAQISVCHTIPNVSTSTTNVYFSKIAVKLKLLMRLIALLETQSQMNVHSTVVRKVKFGVMNSACGHLNLAQVFTQFQDPLQLVVMAQTVVMRLRSTSITISLAVLKEQYLTTMV
jgi:hypothetical protein